VVVLFGVMGALDIPLDHGTAMVAAIALGICVDDTLHFMVRYHDHTRAGARPALALRDTVAHELTPIVTTSLALAAGFAVFLLSSFPPVERFGALSALVMLLALVSTFVLTPLMLTSIRLVTLWEMLSLRLRNEVLLRCPLFRSLKPLQIKRVVLLAEVQRLGRGAVLFREGEPGGAMYVVLEGALEVWREGPHGAPRQLATLGPGDVLGELALVSRCPRTADVVAPTGARLLRLGESGLARIARSAPRIAAVLYHNLAFVVGERLARAEGRAAGPHAAHAPAEPARGRPCPGEAPAPAPGGAPPGASG
jgi:hypothetical protein